ncbi:MAG: hypothetical protein JW808_05740 [Victivallales bacterium]|nr:hypothetical protein [Victivallales bacterium]
MLKMMSLMLAATTFVPSSVYSQDWDDADDGVHAAVAFEADDGADDPAAHGVTEAATEKPDAVVLEGRYEVLGVADFGASPNATAAENTMAINNCFKWAQNNAQVVRFDAGVYNVNDLVFGQDLSVGTSAAPAGLYGHKNGTVLRAAAGTITVISARGINQKFMRDFSIDCNGIAKIGLNTSHGTIGASRNNLYENIKIEKFTSIGWKADNENDSLLKHILIGTPIDEAYIGLQLNGSGGPIHLSGVHCYAGCIMDLAAQNGLLEQCISDGIRFSDLQNADNIYCLVGGYYYGNTANIGTIFTTQAGDDYSILRQLVAIGTLFTTRSAGTSILDGRVAGKIHLLGCSFVGPNARTFFGSNATSALEAGKKSQVVVDGYFATDASSIRFNQSAGFEITAAGVQALQKITGVPQVVDASVASGNVTIITDLEFGRTYEIKVEETTCLNGDPATFRLGTAADSDTFLADTAVTGSTVTGVVISGTEHIGQDVVLTWANTGGAAGAFTVSVVVK